jgi:hypothetical protein
VTSTPTTPTGSSLASQTEDGLAADDPIAALRTRIVKMRVGGGEVSETDALALCVMA